MPTLIKKWCWRCARVVEVPAGTVICRRCRNVSLRNID
jgi:hypothetical protein